MSAGTTESSASRKGTWAPGSGIFPARAAARLDEQLADVREANAHLVVVAVRAQELTEEAEKPHVFERFRQTENATTQRHTGLGLGRGIVRQLVDLHGGTVQAASPGVGRGATFTVRLPIAAGKDRP